MNSFPVFVSQTKVSTQVYMQEFATDVMCLPYRAETHINDMKPVVYSVPSQQLINWALTIMDSNSIVYALGPMFYGTMQVRTKSICSMVPCRSGPRAYVLWYHADQDQEHMFCGTMQVRTKSICYMVPCRSGRRAYVLWYLAGQDKEHMFCGTMQVRTKSICSMVPCRSGQRAYVLWYHAGQDEEHMFYGTLQVRTKSIDRKSTRLNSSHSAKSRMPSSA